MENKILKILGLAIVLVLCLNFASAETQIPCKESDRGLNYYVKGEACIENICKTDFCSGNTLTEYYIEENDASDGICSPLTDVFAEDYICPNGCSDGACLQEESPTAVEEVEEQTRCDIKDAIAEGETKTYTITERDYELEAFIYEHEVKLKLNGETTNILSKGDVYKFIDGIKIQILDVDETEVVFCFEGAVAQYIEPSEEVIRRYETEPVTLPSDLRYYPKFLIRDGKLNAYIVVGDTAPANDVISSVDIAVGLRGYAEVGTTLLVSELGNKVSENNNFIIVGKEANKKLDLYDDLEPLNEGEGLIQILRDRNYIILSVIGYGDIETRSAAKVLSKWQNFDLKGDRVKVLLDRMGNLVLSYPPYEIVEEPVVVIRPTEIPEIVTEVEVPTCFYRVKNDGETGIDCGGPCRPCVATTATCTMGCLGDSTCLPFGTRLVDNQGTPVFCDLSQEFNPQKQERVACQNSYECLSNSCHNGKCIDLEKEIIETRGILEKILDFFREIFS